MTEAPASERFLARLQTQRSAEELEKVQRYFKTGPGEYGEGDVFFGVRMGQVFALAKEFIGMTPAEIERLLDSPIHESRAGALSIMDKQARRYELARSDNVWERGTAIVSTAYFIRPTSRCSTRRPGARGLRRGAKATSTTPTESPRSSSMTTTISSTRRPAGCCATPGTWIASGCSPSWMSTLPPCRARCCAPRWSTSMRTSDSATAVSGRRDSSPADQPIDMSHRPGKVLARLRSHSRVGTPHTHDGTTDWLVQELEAIDGTPIVDVKPVLPGGR